MMEGTSDHHTKTKKHKCAEKEGNVWATTLISTGMQTPSNDNIFNSGIKQI